MKNKIVKFTIILAVFFTSNAILAQSKSENFKSIEVVGFNKTQEPTIHLFDDGHLELIISKYTLEDTTAEFRNEFFNNFKKSLSKNINKEVLLKDNTTFVIEKATEETATKVKNFLERYWK
jgi:hypothetical protein